MRQSNKLAIVAALLVAVWFAWVALQVRSNSDDARASKPEGGDRAASAFAKKVGNMRPNPRPNRQPGPRGAGSRDEGSRAQSRQRVPNQQRRVGRPNGKEGAVNAQREPAGSVNSRAGERVAQLAGHRPQPGGQDAKDQKTTESASGEVKVNPQAAQDNNGSKAAAAKGAPVAPAFVPGPGHIRPNADLNGAQMTEMQLEGVDLTGADLGNADLQRANLLDATLIDANLAGANLSTANLRRADLSDSTLSEAQLNRIDLRGSIIDNAEITDSILARANLGGASLVGVDFSGSNLYEATLFGVDLRNAVLNHTDFKGANLQDANLRDLDLLTAKNLTCGQLKSARNWESTLRPPRLACGAEIPEY